MELKNKVVVSKCAWCQKEMSYSVSDGSNSEITHGICEQCLLDLEYKHLPWSEFLESLDFPILLVDSKGIVKTGNKKAAQALKKELHEIENLPGGNVMECVYADLPEGCGHTEHCSACTIRQTVMKTHETGKSMKNITAFQYLKTPAGDSKMKILISTQKVNNRVLLQIQEIKPR